MVNILYLFDVFSVSTTTCFKVFHLASANRGRRSSGVPRSSASGVLPFVIGRKSLLIQKTDTYNKCTLVCYRRENIDSRKKVIQKRYNK